MPALRRRAGRVVAVVLAVVASACDDGEGAPTTQVSAAAVPSATAPSPAPSASGGAPPPAGPDLRRLLEDPTMTGEHQLPPHAVLQPAADAVAGDPRSEWQLPLDGRWRLALVERPDEVPPGFWDVDFDAGGWGEVDVPHTWQSDGLDHPIFRNIATEMVPDDPPFPPRDLNPTGAYVRDVDLPASWTAQRRTIIRFDGVTSAWALWVNGRYVGADQGGYLPAEFDVTDAVRAGRNRVAVQVHRWSAGSYLEDYDQWRSAGIFRSVTMRSVPLARITDVAVSTDVDDDMAGATLAVAVDVAVDDGAPAPSRLVARLSPDDPAAGPLVEVAAAVEAPSGSTTTVAASARVERPSLWSDEVPTLHDLTLDLVADDGTVLHRVRQRIGIREVAVVDGELRLNGRRVVIRGVNRTETHPDTGRHQPRDVIEQDLLAMKRLNLNAVRTAHSPADPALYELADELGVLVVDEVEVETHAHESCPQDCLADQEAWQPAMLERFQGMVERDRNHPSVVMWSTGNEAGLGAAHEAMARWADANEPSRPLLHQSNVPNGDAPHADVAGPRYLSPEQLAAADASATKPIVMGEYAHAQGNGLGNLAEHWDVIRASRHVQGGFVWDWADQDLRSALITTPDRSPNDVAAMLAGLPAVVPGRHGQAVELSGLDDTIEIYRHPALDITGTGLTIDAVVRPVDGAPGGFTILSKGEQYVLGATADGTLELAITSGGTRQAAVAPLPADWAGTWHRVTGTYDGAALRLHVDGAEVAAQPWTGPIDHSGHHLAVGRNTATMAELYGGRTATGAVDQVRVYDVALSPAELADGADPVERAVLALDLDEFADAGTYLSYGLYESGTDGVVDAERTPQPEATELAWVLAPIRVTDVDARRGIVRVHNERAVLGTADVVLRWRVTEGSATLESGTADVDVAPGAALDVALPVTTAVTAGPERHLTVDVVTRERSAWAPAGHRLSFGQFEIGGEIVPLPDGGGGRAVGDLTVTDGADAVEVTSTSGVTATLDKRTGTLSSLQADGTELLHTGPVLDAWRAPISNETSTWGGDEATAWRAVGLDRLVTVVTGVDVGPPGDTVDVTVRSVVAAPDVADASFEQTMRFSFDGRGAVRITQSVTPTGRLRELPYLPRLGLRLAVPDSLSAFSWYGRGPGENYRDRRHGSPVGTYETSVDDQYVEYRRPQDHGNHTDVRWAALRSPAAGLLAVADPSAPLEVAVSSFDEADRAPYPHLLQRNAGWTTLHLDAAASGVGDTPNSVLPDVAVPADAALEHAVTLVPL